jgi:pantothenate kinase type III
VIIGGVVPELKARISKAWRKAGWNVEVFRKDIPPHIEIVPRPAERVGDDRIASALGALALDPSRPWVVVDAGTAMTINAVTPRNKGKRPRFEGGLIVPGTAMSLKALAHFTAQLPDLSAKKFSSNKSFIGRNTEEAMLLGVHQASIATAVTLAKGQIGALGPRTHVVLTGGGVGPIFLKAFKDAFSSGMVRMHPYLVDLGLFSCWEQSFHS